MYINKIQYNWNRNAGFCISGPVFNYYNLFCFQSRAQIKVDGQFIETEPNACILSQPKQARYFFLPENAAIHWFHAYKELLPMLKMYDIPLNQVFYPDDPELISDLFRQMHREFYTGGRNREQMIDTLLQALLIALSRNDVAFGEAGGIGYNGRIKLRDLRTALLSQPENSN